MKNFTISFSKLMMVSIILLLLPTFTQAQSHFGTVNGNSLNNTWTLYLTDINMDLDNAAAGDELAIFDGTTLVGVYEFDGTETLGNNDYTDTPVVAFTEVNSGTGYTAGNTVTFKFWDDSESMEYTGVFDADNTYDGVASGGDLDDYIEVGADSPTYPTGANPYSYINLTFSSGYSVSGTITLGGDCGGDVENVLVNAYSGGSLYGTTFSDSEGDYTINGLTGGVTYLIEASLTNFTTNSTTSGEVNDDVVDIDITLTPHTGNISGTVTDATTAAAITDGGLVVELYDTEDNLIDTYTDTDVDGDFEFTDICVGNYYLVVSHDDYTNATGDEFSLANGDNLDKDFALNPLPGSISGQVREDDGVVGTFTGNVLPNIVVTATNYNVDPAVTLFTAVTDASGNFTAANVPAGTWYVKAQGGNYAADSIQVSVTANAGSTGNEIELEPVPGLIEGTVRDAGTSALLSGVTITVTGTAYTTTTNGSGYYQIEDVTPGTYEVVFTHVSYATETVEDVVVNSWTATTVNANLEAEPGTIKVGVKDDGANPIAGATVTIGTTYTATDGGAGIYTFSDMPVGNYDISISKTGYHDETIEDVQVTSGITTTTTATLTAYHYIEVSGNTVMPIWTVYLQTITLDGENIEADDEIAVYDGATLVGVYYVTGTLTSGNATNQDLSAYSQMSDGSAGYTAGNSYTFKLWDASAGTEVTSPTVTLSDPGASGAFEGDVFPTGMSPFSFATLEFRSEESQTFNLAVGYQLISARVLATEMDMGSIMFGTRANLDFVKEEGGQQHIKIAGTWINNIGDWEITEGFLVKMTNADAFTMTGTPVDPQTEIPLHNGFSIVSYLHESSMDVATAFANVQDNLVFVRNSAGKHYWKIGGAWVNNIGNLNPGEGYFVKTSAVDTLIYPAAAKSETIVLDNDSPTFFAISNGDATEPVYTIYVQSEELQAGDEIAAYNGDILVGATVIEDPTDASANDLNIFSVLNEDQGYVAGNEVTFKVWSPRTNEVYTNVAIDYLNPHGDAYTENTYPEGEENYSIVKASVNELDVEELEIASVNIYPNPATDQLRIQSKTDISEIRVINAIGQTLLVKQIDTNDYILNVSNMESGFYILQITSEDRQSSLRFNVK